MKPRYAYLIAMGSNLGDRSENLNNSIIHLKNSGFHIIKVATTFENPPIGHADRMFLNSACLIETDVEPTTMIKALLDIEKKLGRLRTIESGNRTIDHDIILARDVEGRKDIQITKENLVIPHPRAHLRDFVMIPAAEICGDWLFPSINITVKELADQLRKTSIY